MNYILATRIAALLGFLGVALGAFGAHALKDLLARHNMTDVWKTAVLYQLIHAVVLLFLASRTTLNLATYNCFLIGIILFSGSLYLLATTGAKWLGPITPIGGLFLLAGWVLLFLKAR